MQSLFTHDGAWLYCCQLRLCIPVFWWVFNKSFQKFYSTITCCLKRCDCRLRFHRTCQHKTTLQELVLTALLTPPAQLDLPGTAVGQPVAPLDRPGTMSWCYSWLYSWLRQLTSKTVISLHSFMKPSVVSASLITTSLYFSLTLIICIIWLIIFAESAFAYMAPKIWNNLPLGIKSSMSYQN